VYINISNVIDIETMFLYYFKVV